MYQLIVVVTVVFAVLVFVGVAWFITDSSLRVRRFARSTDILPGRPGTAPTEWTTSTDPAAVLHRRIRYAIALVHENHTLAADPGTVAALGRLDDAVVALDARLVAATTTAPGTTTGTGDEASLTTFGYAVDALERLPGRLVYVPYSEIRARIDETATYLATPTEPLETGESPYPDDDLG